MYVDADLMCFWQAILFLKASNEKTKTKLKKNQKNNYILRIN